MLPVNHVAVNFLITSNFITHNTIGDLCIFVEIPLVLKKLPIGTTVYQFGQPVSFYY